MVLQLGPKVVGDLGSQDQLLVDRRGHGRRPEEGEVVEHGGEGRCEGLQSYREAVCECPRAEFRVPRGDRRRGRVLGGGDGSERGCKSALWPLPAKPHPVQRPKVPSLLLLSPRILEADSIRSNAPTLKSSVHPFASNSSARTSLAFPVDPPPQNPPRRLSLELVPTQAFSQRITS